MLCLKFPHDISQKSNKNQTIICNITLLHFVGSNIRANVKPKNLINCSSLKSTKTNQISPGPPKQQFPAPAKPPIPPMPSIPPQPLVGLPQPTQSLIGEFNQPTIPTRPAAPIVPDLISGVKPLTQPITSQPIAQPLIQPTQPLIPLNQPPIAPMLPSQPIAPLMPTQATMAPMAPMAPIMPSQPLSQPLITPQPIVPLQNQPLIPTNPPLIPNQPLIGGLPQPLPGPAPLISSPPKPLIPTGTTAGSLVSSPPKAVTTMASMQPVTSTPIAAVKAEELPMSKPGKLSKY